LYSEVLVHLIEHYYNIQIGEPIEKMTKTLEIVTNMLEGTWGLVIIHSDCPNTLFATRYGSPLLVGYDDNNAIITSEQSGFNRYVRNYFVLNNRDICIINKDRVLNIETKENYEKRIVNQVDRYDCSPFEHFMIKEIYEQEHSCLRSLKLGSRLKEEHVRLGGLDQQKDILKALDNIIILGCGTSYFAGLYGSHFFKQLCYFNSVQVIDGADFNINDVNKKGRTGLILLSQSGETKDLYRVIKIAQSHDLFTIGVVNVVDSLIAREVNCGCYIHAGKEMAVASTKSFTSQVIVLVLISLWFSQNCNYDEAMLQRQQVIKDIHNLSMDIKRTLMQHENIKKFVDYFKDQPSLFLLGKGPGESIAKEGALKIKEVSYIHAEGYSTSSLKHGPFALLKKDFPVILLCGDDEYLSKNINAYEEINSRNANVIKIISSHSHSVSNEKNIIVPQNSSFSYLLMVIVLQLLSYETAISKNINPDKPRNLAKVVTVE
jgi:glucosamine--fructose-6-phosphate aminotransferase (isomerizing)